MKVVFFIAKTPFLPFDLMVKMLEGRRCIETTTNSAEISQSNHSTVFPSCGRVVGLLN